VNLLVRELERALPQQIEGIYLVGSLALGDFRSGQSDIDFIAIANPTADMIPVADVHRTIAAAHPEIHCDGVYLRSGELALPPAGTGPSARQGNVVFASGDERHAVTWLTLLRHGITVRGNHPSSAWIAADEFAAAAYSRSNLRSYWQPWIDQRRSLEGLDDWSVVWGCLGVARLHAAVAKREMLSKSDGGRYALEHFPQHRSIVGEALRVREGGTSGYNSAAQRSSDLIEFMDHLINSVV
jgi:hypothetical protein